MNDQAFQMGQDAGGGGAALIALLCWVVVVVAIGALMFWGVFKKARITPWLSMVPIVNAVMLLRVAGRPAWWLVGFFIPIVSIVVSIVVSIDVARKFGKETGYVVGLVLLPFVFYPILGFGDATYDASR